MLFQIDNNELLLFKSNSGQKISEKELEDLISGYSEEKSESPLTELSENIFKEPLLLLSRQTCTQQNKRADIFALNKQGNGVIIELKKDEAKMGVETQALQYLCNFSALTGEAFLEHHVYDRNKEKKDKLRNRVEEWLADEVKIDQINKKSNIILMAREFDKTLFSMGEWLDSQGVAFRCIKYDCYDIEGKKHISFSIDFDRSKDATYRLQASQNMRAPKIFWHNIGTKEERFWDYQRKQGIITCGFDGKPGDRGEQILHGYIKGDKIIAYASGKGAIGYGVIEKVTQEEGYKLLLENSDEAKNTGGHLHTQKIIWKATLPFAKALKVPSKEYPHLYHPVQTSSRVGNQQEAQELVALIKKAANADSNASTSLPIQESVGDAA